MANGNSSYITVFFKEISQSSKTVTGVQIGSENRQSLGGGGVACMHFKWFGKILQILEKTVHILKHKKKHCLWVYAILGSVSLLIFIFLIYYANVG